MMELHWKHWKSTSTESNYGRRDRGEPRRKVDYGGYREKRWWWRRRRRRRRRERKGQSAKKRVCIQTKETNTRTKRLSIRLISYTHIPYNSYSICMLGAYNVKQILIRYARCTYHISAYAIHTHVCMFIFILIYIHTHTHINNALSNEMH